MIVDPWGLVLATAPDAETIAVADLDLAAQDDDPPRGCPRSPTGVLRRTLAEV